MAEALHLQCKHEKQLLRKELHKLEKTTLQLIGIEAICNQLLGQVRWNKLQKLLYGACYVSENDQSSEDFKPFLECWFCNSGSDLEIPSTYQENGLEESLEINHIATLASTERSISVKENRNPSNIFESVSQKQVDWADTDQPLDLRINISHESENPGNSILRIPNLTEHSTSRFLADNEPVKFVPVLKTRKMREASGKKRYTSEELKAALNDIQSGKLGTRRAAVIYGIPRSTLRNKVYKLSQQISVTINSNNTNKGKSEKKLKSWKYLQRASKNEDSFKRRLRNRLEEKKQSEEVITKDEDHQPSTYLQNAKIRSLLKNLYDNLLEIALNRTQHLIPVKQIACEYGNLSMLSDILKKLVKERLRKMFSENLTVNAYDELESHVSDVQNYQSVPKSELFTGKHINANYDNDCYLSNVILKIPSYKFSYKSSLLIQEGKENDVKSVSDNCTENSSLETKSVIACDFAMEKSDSFQKLESGCDGENWAFDEECDPHLHMYLDGSKRFGKNANNNELEPHLKDFNIKNTNLRVKIIGKGSRPKRGKYRNYDRDNLAKAVQAVQNGEMTVHRAGSYFGVPHSTLEYKVKERHLLRPRKRPLKSQETNDKDTHNLSIAKSKLRKYLENTEQEDRTQYNSFLPLSNSTYAHDISKFIAENLSKLYNRNFSESTVFQNLCTRMPFLLFNSKDSPASALNHSMWETFDSKSNDKLSDIKKYFENTFLGLTRNSVEVLIKYLLENPNKYFTNCKEYMHTNKNSSFIDDLHAAIRAMEVEEDR